MFLHHRYSVNNIGTVASGFRIDGTNVLMGPVDKYASSVFIRLSLCHCLLRPTSSARGLGKADAGEFYHFLRLFHLLYFIIETLETYINHNNYVYTNGHPTY